VPTILEKGPRLILKCHVVQLLEIQFIEDRALDSVEEAARSIELIAIANVARPGLESPNHSRHTARAAIASMPANTRSWTIAQTGLGLRSCRGASDTTPRRNAPAPSPYAWRQCIITALRSLRSAPIDPSTGRYPRGQSVRLDGRPCRTCPGRAPQFAQASYRNQALRRRPS